MPYHRGHSRRPVQPYYGRAAVTVSPLVTLTDTPSAHRLGGPDGVVVIDLAITDLPSGIRIAGPDGVQGSGVSITGDLPDATRYAGPDGSLTIDLVITDRPTGVRSSGPDGAVDLGLTIVGDSPSAIRYGGPSGSVFADVGGGVTITGDTPSATRHGGADGSVSISVPITGDTPAALRAMGPDGALAIGVIIVGDSPSASRYAGPNGVVVIVVGGTDTPNALRVTGPDGSMGIATPIVGDHPSAIRCMGPSGTLVIGAGADTIVTDRPTGVRMGGPSGDVLLAFLPTRVPYVSPAPLTAPAYSLWVADTVTGRMLWELPMESQNWTSTLNDIGTLQATLQIEKTWDSLSDQDERDPRILMREVISGPWRFCLVVLWGNNPVWAGPYISMSRPQPNQVQLGAAEIGKMFAKRVVMAPGAISPVDVTADTVIGPSTTKPHAAYVLLNQAMTGTGRSLPITLADPGGSGTDLRTYYGYDLRKTWDALHDLMGEDDGPEVRFDPVITAGSDANYLGWIAQIGSPHVGRTVTPWTFDDDVSAITTMDVDASGMALGVWSGGSGSSRDKIIAHVTDTSLFSVGYPMLEEVDTAHSSETASSILTSEATSVLAADKVPVTSFKVSVPADRDPMAGTFRVGEDFQITVQDDPIVPDGVYLRRIGSIAGTERPWIDITDVAPLPVGSS